MIAVIDTNVIVDNPFFFNLLKNTRIVLPMVVLEELDKLKSQDGIVGKNCRTFIHNLKQIIENDRKQGSNVFAFMNDIPGLSSNDNTIIASAQKLMVKHANVILYTNDINMQIKALAKKIVAKSFVFEPEQNVYEKSYIDLTMSDSDLNSIKSGKTIYEQGYENCYVLINGSFPAKIINEQITRLVSVEDGVMGFKSKNLEQTFALDALLDDDIKLVSLIGVAGTGKTLVATAAALYKTLDDSKYDNVIITRPTVSMGKELGYLPGTADEKLLPWMQPFFDNIEVLMGDGSNKFGAAQTLIDSGVIKMESLSHIRGRSFARKYIIIDESQNLDKHELKTIISRASEGTKIILTGDVYQIDTKGLDISNNGLTYVTERFKGEDIFANITLTKTERSRLSELAGKLL